MNIVYLDTSAEDAQHFVTVCRDIECVKNVMCFYDCNKALEYIKSNKVDLVYCEINLENANGIDYIGSIRQVSSHTGVVYVTYTSEHAVRAFEVGASGYIIKPCCAEKILIPINRFLDNRPIVEIRTFGSFELFVDNSAVLFSNKKAKELLALMVDRCGNSLTMEQVIDVLWEERPFDENTKALYRIALKALRDTLKKYNCSHIIRESRGQRSLDVTKVKCDYYEYLNNPSQYEGFYGEYMTNYSWGEYTLAKICQNNY